MNAFMKAYVECALWSSTDGSGEPLDKNYSVNDIAPETLAAMSADCQVFEDAGRHLWTDTTDEEQAGHDFWLSRNDHGAGFSDAYRGIPYTDENAAALQALAEGFGEVNLYVGDDGMIHQ